MEKFLQVFESDKYKHLKINGWYQHCIQHCIPYIILTKMNDGSVTLEWDGITYSNAQERVLIEQQSYFTQIFEGIYSNFANKRAGCFSSSIRTLYIIGIPASKIKVAATRLYDSINYVMKEYDWVHK